MVTAPQNKTSPSLRFTTQPLVAPPVHISLDVDDEESKVLESVFVDMDVDCNQLVNQAEFRAYLKKNPRGWPLADVLAGQPEDVKDQIVSFWFRKLDLNSAGSFDKNELIAFFRAMKQTKYKEMIYADFLLNLFDTNYDGKLDREEYATMLRVLLGRDVPTYVLSSVSAEGLSREDLVSLLHSIHCDFTQLDNRNVVPSSRSFEFILVGVAAAAAIAGFVGASVLKK